MGLFQKVLPPFLTEKCFALKQDSWLQVTGKLFLYIWNFLFVRVRTSLWPLNVLNTFRIHDFVTKNININFLIIIYI